LFIVEREMQLHKLDIVGLSETHWKGDGHFTTTQGNSVFLGARFGEPDILRSEVEKAITHLKSNKAPGTDDIAAEMIKLLGN